MSFFRLVSSIVVMKGVVDIVVCVTSFQFDCFL